MADEPVIDGGGKHRGRTACLPRRFLFFGFDAFAERFAEPADSIVIARCLHAALPADKIGDLQRRFGGVVSIPLHRFTRVDRKTF